MLPNAIQMEEMQGFAQYAMLLGLQPMMINKIQTALIQHALLMRAELEVAEQTYLRII